MLVLPKRINERAAVCVIERSRVEIQDRWLPHRQCKKPLSNNGDGVARDLHADG